MILNSFSSDMVSKNSENSNVDLNDFLELYNINDDFEWKSLIENPYRQMVKTSNLLYKAVLQRSATKRRKIIHNNAHYKDKDVIRTPNRIISKQEQKILSKTNNLSKFLRKRTKQLNNVCQRLIKKTPKYKEIITELGENRETLEKGDILEQFQAYRKELDIKLNEIELDLSQKREDE